MAAVNPHMERLRCEKEEWIRKDRASKFEAADSLISQCEECTLPWLELAASVRERICRQVQLTCYDQLAERLGVDAVDRRFCADQVSGQLKSSTELMLEDVMRGRAEPLPAAFLLRFLRERSLLRILDDVTCGVQEACARQKQQRLLGRASGSPMDSGYQSGEHIVGVLSELPDGTLVEAAPVRAAPSDYSDEKEDKDKDAKDEDVKEKRVQETPQPAKPKSKKLMLTYTQDGRDAAQDMVEKLKAFDFRVLQLEKQRRHRQSDPYSAVQKWFTGVDYIIPVLTPEYLRATQNLAEPRGEPARSLVEDARLVYSLMCAEMERNRHVNYRVRAVVPDGVEDSLRDHPLYGSPLFRFPFQVSDLEMLVECLEA